MTDEVKRKVEWTYAYNDAARYAHSKPELAVSTRCTFQRNNLAAQPFGFLQPKAL